MEFKYLKTGYLKEDEENVYKSDCYYRYYYKYKFDNFYYYLVLVKRERHPKIETSYDYRPPQFVRFNILNSSINEMNNLVELYLLKNFSQIENLFKTNQIENCRKRFSKIFTKNKEEKTFTYPSEAVKKINENRITKEEVELVFKRWIIDEFKQNPDYEKEVRETTNIKEYSKASAERFINYLKEIKRKSK